MYSELSKALNEVVSFTNKHRITAKFNIHSVGDLQGKNGTPDIYWATFEKKAGVYIPVSYTHLTLPTILLV